MVLAKFKNGIRERCLVKDSYAAIKGGALTGERYRVIVSTDIGGSDPDDFQSMVHYLLYSDVFDTEGLISSPWGDGTTQDIFDVIEAYTKDYPNLIRHSKDYPTPEYLRSITKQGSIDIAPYQGYSKSTEGSDWIVQCAKKDDPRPLYVLVWGLLDDVAQALYDDPSIQDKLRIYYIAGPNKKWGVNSHAYIERNFPNLWIIENNSTYRGWFNGGDQTDDLGNQSFVNTHIQGHGALGDFFCNFLDNTIKMGDTPSVAYLLRGNPEDPTSPSWGGQFIPVHARPNAVFRRNTTKNDLVEMFSLIEYVFKGPHKDIDHNTPTFKMLVKGQEFPGYYVGNGEYRIRFMPKSLGAWSYVTKSSIPELDGQQGEFVSVPESNVNRGRDPLLLPNWWSDILDSELRDGIISGSKTVNQWRVDYLRDFQSRMDRCLNKE